MFYNTIPKQGYSFKTVYPQICISTPCLLVLGTY